MPPLLWITPLLLVFEVWQLVISERYLGIRQIEHDADPRALRLSEFTAFCWSLGILLSWAWAVAMLFQRVGQIQALCMVAITVVGYSMRRNCSIKWVLVILTFEGALRVGMLMSLIGLAWRRL